MDNLELVCCITLEVQGRASRGLHFFQEPIVNLGTHHEPWYQDLSTKILVPRSWYQDLVSKIYGEPERRSLSVCRGGLQAPRQGVWGAGSPPGRAGGLGGGSPRVKTFLL